MSKNIQMNAKNSVGGYDILYPETTAENIVEGAVPVVHGGTGATDATTALENLGGQTEITGGATTVTDDNLAVSRALVSDTNGKIAVSDITSTELGYLDGVTSNVQTQLNNKQASLGFTPVQQDGTNVVKLGWDSTNNKLGLTVDSTSKGNFVLDNNAIYTQLTQDNTDPSAGEYSWDFADDVGSASTLNHCRIRLVPSLKMFFIDMSLTIYQKTTVEVPAGKGIELGEFLMPDISSIGYRQVLSVSSSASADSTATKHVQATLFPTENNYHFKLILRWLNSDFGGSGVSTSSGFSYAITGAVMYS